MKIQDKLDAFKRLLIIMDELREQCPWDRKQTMESLRNLTIEETYELADAILDNDMQEIKEEIGDVMLHMVFYSKIARRPEILISQIRSMRCVKSLSIDIPISMVMYM